MTVIPIYMALAPVPFAIGYIWRTGAHPEERVNPELSRAFATGAVLGSLFALVIAAVFLEDGFDFLAAFVAVGVVGWLAVALDQGERRDVEGSAVARGAQRGAMLLLGIGAGAALGVIPWVALVAVLRSL